MGYSGYSIESQDIEMVGGKNPHTTKKITTPHHYPIGPSLAPICS